MSDQLAIGNETNLLTILSWASFSLFFENQSNVYCDHIYIGILTLWSKAKQPALELKVNKNCQEGGGLLEYIIYGLFIYFDTFSKFENFDLAI